MKTRLFLTATLLLATSPALAQTNPCDRPPLTGNIVVTSAEFSFAVCAPAADEIDGVMVYVDGAAIDFGGVAGGAPNSQGNVPYIVSITLPGRGNHKVEYSTYTLTSGGTKQEGPRGDPFVLAFEKGTPSKPTAHPVN